MEAPLRRADEEVFETPDLGTGEADAFTSADGAGTARPDALGLTKVPDAEVVSGTVAPSAAFEVFMGKTYADGGDLSDSISRPEWRGKGGVFEASGGRGTTAGGGKPGAGVPVESPMERLLRLKAESAQLAEDLEEMHKAGSGGDGGTGSVRGEGHPGEGAGGDAVQLWAAMARETDRLQQELVALSADPKYKAILSPSPSHEGAAAAAAQQELSSRVIDCLARLRDGAARGTPLPPQASTPTGAPPAASAAAAAAGPAAAEAESGVKSGAVAEARAGAGGAAVTFELFYEEAAAAARQGRGGSLSGGGLGEMEARLALLEKAVGGGSGAGAGGGGGGCVVAQGPAQPMGLVDMVALLEQRLMLLEPGQLEAVQQRAALARLELEALAKAQAGAGDGGGSRARKVEEAYSTLQQWQAFASSLPALVERLRTLEGLHQSSAGLARRLQQAEDGKGRLATLLSSTSANLEATRSSLAENLGIMQDNAQALDARMAALAEHIK